MEAETSRVLMVAIRTADYDLAARLLEAEYDRGFADGQWRESSMHDVYNEAEADSREGQYTAWEIIEGR